MSDTETFMAPSQCATSPDASAIDQNTGDSTNAQPRLIDQAKEQAQKVVGQTQQKAGEVIGQAKDRTKSWAEDQKSAVAQGLSDIALAVTETGENLRGRGPDTYGKYAAVTDQAAELVDNASAYLRDTSVDQMIGQVEGFGKREPMLFLVGAAALGFLAARFLKSSNRSSGQDALAYNPDRTLPVPMGAQDRGMGTNYDTTSPAG